MKKANKILLGLAPLGATLAVLPLAAACGPKSAKFDQYLDKKIKIATGFSSDGPQYIALKSLIDKYNETIKKDGWSVEIAPLAGGYNTDTLAQKLKGKDTKEFWNLIINYPASASLIASYEMSLPFPNDEYASFDIAPAFKDVNNTIAGNVNKDKLVVPMSRSTEMVAIAKALLGKLLDDLIVRGEVTKSQTNTKLIDDYINFYKTQTDEAAYIDKLWNSARTELNDSSKVEIKSLVPLLDDSVFESFEPLINMSIAMKKMYGNDNRLYVLGIDSVPSAINTMVSALTKGDINSGYITPDESAKIDGGWDYNTFINNPKSKQAKIFKQAADVLINGIKNKAVWIGGDGAYGSSQLTSYKMAMSIGSTAGYSHTYVSKASKTIYSIEGTDEGISFENANKIEVKENDNSVAFVLKSGSYANNVYKSSSDKELTKYEFRLSQKDDSIDFKKYSGWFWVKSQNDWEVKDGKLLIKYTTKDKQGTKTLLSNQFVSLEALDGAGASNKYYLINPSQIKETKLSGASIVNESDADWIHAPYNKNSSDTFKAIFEQGPSFVGIHSNEEENAQTIKFIKWFFTENLQEMTITQSRNGKVSKTLTKQNIKPIDMFNIFGGYVSPTSSFFNNDPKDLGLSKANLLAFNQFNLINKDGKTQNYITAEDVASVRSDSLRKTITSASKSLQNNALNSPKDVTFEKFIQQISILFQ